MRKHLDKTTMSPTESSKFISTPLAVSIRSTGRPKRKVIKDEQDTFKGLYTMPPTVESSTIRPSLPNTPIEEESDHDNDVQDIYDNDDTLNQEVYQYDTELREEYRANKGTDPAYGRVLSRYEEWWTLDQMRREEEAAENKTEYNPKYRNPHPITPKKVCVFLKYESNRRKKSGSKGKELPNTTVGRSAIQQAISALEAAQLERQRHPEYQLDSDSHMRLRDYPEIKMIEKAAKAREPKRNDKVQKTKAKGAISDTFNEAELVQMTTEYLCRPNGKSKINIHTALRNWTMLVFTTSMALRGDDTRSILLSDIQFEDIPMLDIGPGCSIKALTILSNQGKTNTMGRIDRYAAFRHLDVLRCPITALALLFFSRFHILNDFPFNDFKPQYDHEEATEEFGHRQWYRIVLFAGQNDPYSPMSAENHRAQFNLLKALLELAFGKSTHSGRGFGATTAISNGASPDSVRALGIWSQPGSFQVYNRALPVQAMIASAGFNGHRLESYFIPRDVLDPPAELMVQLFPWVEAEMESLQIRQRTHGSKAQDAALGNLFNLLLHFRRTLLQDCAVLYQNHSDAPVFKFPPFTSSLFREFAAKSAQIIHQAEEHDRMQLQNLPYQVASTVKGVINMSYQRNEGHHQDHKATTDKLIGRMDGLTQIAKAGLIIVASVLPPKKRKQLEDLMVYMSDSNTGATALSSVSSNKRARMSPENLTSSTAASCSISMSSRAVSQDFEVEELESTTLPLPTPSNPLPLVAQVLTSAANQSVDLVSDTEHSQIPTKYHTPPTQLEAQARVTPDSTFPALLASFAQSQSSESKYFASGNGHIYFRSTFPIDHDCPITYAAQMKYVANLEQHILPDQLRQHTFEWIDNEYLPLFAEYWKPSKNTQPSISDVWKEYSEGIGGRMSIIVLNTHWSSRWKRNRSSLKTESSRRMKIIDLIKRLAQLPGWSTARALIFIDTEYSTFKTSRPFSDYLQSKKGIAEGKPNRTECVIAHALSLQVNVE